MAFEDNLSNVLVNQRNERTYLDKLLSREDQVTIKTLMKKPKLSKDELLELLHLCQSTESKLTNIDVWDRYYLGKFFVWIREFMRFSSQCLDMEQEYTKNLELTPESKKAFERLRELNEEGLKFLMDLYLNILRSSLSIGGTGFLEILKNRFEIKYDTNPVVTHQTPERKFFGLSLNKGENKT